MKNMSKVLSAFSFSFVAMAANASTWSALDPSNPGFNYSVSPANEIWYFDGNITPQSPANIGSVVENQFSLASGSLSYLSGCDSPTYACTNATGGTSSGIYTNTFNSDVAFNYLAVHYGRAELLFHWDSAITAFNFGDIVGVDPDFRGLSNYRAYGDPSAVPVPSALWLFGSAIMGFMGFASRRKL